MTSTRHGETRSLITTERGESPFLFFDDFGGFSHFSYCILYPVFMGPYLSPYYDYDRARGPEFRRGSFIAYQRRFHRVRF